MTAHRATPESLFTFLRRWADGIFLGIPHDALTYVQGNLGLKPRSSRYGWWRRCHCRSYHRRTGLHAEGCPRG